MKLNVKACGLTFGLIWGLGLFFLTWWVILFEGTTHDLLVIGHIYRGYNVSPMGSLIGMLYGFADGGVGGVVISWIYNTISSRVK